MVYSIKILSHFSPMAGLTSISLTFAIHAVAVLILISPARAEAEERLLFESYIESSSQLFLESSLDQAYQKGDDALSIASSPTLKPFRGQNTDQIKTRWERISTLFLGGAIAYKADDRQKAHALFKEVTTLTSSRIENELRRADNLLTDNLLSGYFRYVPNPLAEAYEAFSDSCESKKIIDLYKHIELAYRLGPSLRRNLLSQSASCYLTLQIRKGVKYSRLNFPAGNITPIVSSTDHSLLSIVKSLYAAAPNFIDYALDDATFAAKVVHQTRYYDAKRTITVLEETLRQPTSHQSDIDKRLFTLSTLVDSHSRNLLINCAKQTTDGCKRLRQRLETLQDQLQTEAPFDDASWSKGYAYLSLAEPYDCFSPSSSKKDVRQSFRKSKQALESLPTYMSLNPKSRLLFAFALCFKTKNWNNPPEELSSTISAIRRSGLEGYNHSHFTIWEPLLENTAIDQSNSKTSGEVPVFDLPRSAPFFLLSVYLNGTVSAPRKAEDPTVLVAVAKDPVFTREVQAVFPAYWAPEILALSMFARNWLAEGDFRRAETVSETMVELLHSKRTPVWNAVALRYTTELFLNIGGYAAAIKIYDYFGSEGRLSLPEYLLEPTDLRRVRARVLSIKASFDQAAQEYEKIPLFSPERVLEYTRSHELSSNLLPVEIQQMLATLELTSAFWNPEQSVHPKWYHLTLGLAHLTSRLDSSSIGDISDYPVCTGVADIRRASGNERANACSVFTSAELEKYREIFARHYPDQHLRIAALDAALSTIFMQNDQQKKARKLASRALELLGDHNASIPIPHEFDTAWYVNPSRYIILRATETLASTGGFRQKQLRTLFRALQNFRRDLGQRETELTIARVTHQNAEGLIRAYERLQRDYRSATESLLNARTSASSRGIVELRNHAGQLFSKLEDTRSQLKREAPGYLNILRQNIVDLSDIQSQLEADELAVFTQIVNQTFFVLQITDESVKLRLTSLNSDELGTMVEDVRHLVTEECKKSSGACVSEKARKLARIIFGKMDLNEFKRVIIFPDSALASLPFAALPIDEKYLLERVAHIIAPSPSAFYFGRKRSVANKDDMTTFFGLADPSFDAGQTLADRSTIGVDAIFRSGRVVSPVNLSELPRLPETYTEATGVAKAFNLNDTVVVKGSEARERTVRSRSLSQFDVLLFATHGLMANQLVGQDEAGLALTPPRIISDTLDDGYLSASEVASLRLDADVVILSACNTARDTVGIGYGLSQLSRSFMYAGARSLVATHWEVESKFTSDLIRSTVQIHRDDNKRIAEALRLAILSEIEKSPSLYSDPSRWAPYLVISAD